MYKRNDPVRQFGVGSFTPNDFTKFRPKSYFSWRIQSGSEWKWQLCFPPNNRCEKGKYRAAFENTVVVDSYLSSQTLARRFYPKHNSNSPPNYVESPPYPRTGHANEKQNRGAVKTQCSTPFLLYEGTFAKSSLMPEKQTTTMLFILRTVPINHRELSRPIRLLGNPLSHSARGTTSGCHAGNH